MDTDRPGLGPNPAVYRWRVKLRYDSEPVIVETTKNLPMYAVAACMDKAGFSAFDSMAAHSVERLGDNDGDIVKTWN